MQTINFVLWQWLEKVCVVCEFYVTDFHGVYWLDLISETISFFVNPFNWYKPVRFIVF